jgi:tripartite-type tricarboxylate transporter receptor subunit TctC
MRVLILFLLCLPGLLGAASYPDRPVTLIVPFAEGSDTDLFAQNFTRHMSKYLGRARFQLTYMPGESGSLAAQHLLRQPGDGYTLMLGRIASQVIAPAMQPSLPYRWNSFSTLSIPEILPLICAVRTDSPYRTARDLISALRQKPGQLKFGVSGKGTILNFAVQYMLHVSGLPPSAALPVDLQSAPQVTQALIDGRIDFACNNALSLLQPIQSGRLRGLFTTAPGRLSDLPQLPNAREAGLRDMSQLIGWNAIVAPAGLPADVLARWQAALTQLAQDPAWQAGSQRLGGLPAIDSIRDPQFFLRGQSRLYEQLVANLVPQP